MTEEHGPGRAGDAPVQMFRITSLREGHVVIHQVAGELDSLTAPQLSDALADTDPAADLVVDLTEVPFLSSAGLSVLIDHFQRSQRRNVTFSVVATGHATLLPLRITALDSVIPLYTTVADAVRATEQRAQ
jgi:anti-anti-sigma factor